jgi:hypothetical protein
MVSESAPAAMNEHSPAATETMVPPTVIVCPALAERSICMAASVVWLPPTFSETLPFTTVSRLFITVTVSLPPTLTVRSPVMTS